MDKDQIIRHLALAPHPEGGHYRETCRMGPAEGSEGRAFGTCIYFLLSAGERSHWHHVDATEIWHFYAGAPLILSISKTESGPKTDHILGPDLTTGALPQRIVPPLHWQSARTTGDWTLVGCTVSPGFEFEGFTLAPPDFGIP